jgi:MFS family permease
MQRSNQLTVKNRPQTSTTSGGVPRTVVALGVVSLFMDTSSEIIHSLLPAFLVTVLGVGALSIGIIEGIAEATTSIVKIFSGGISDWIGHRKPLVLLGYGLAAMTKPLFPLAGGVGLVLAARFLDRVGKGIRGAPRDALIADVTPTVQRGAAFGLRQSMDTVGAFLGPILAMLLMAVSNDAFRLVFWVAVIPAAASLPVIIFGVQEPAAAHSGERREFPIRRAELVRLNAEFWWLVGIATILTLARFSEAFLLLAAQNAGMKVALIPAILVTMNIVYAVTAYPVGRLSDRIGRRGLLLAGVGTLIMAAIVLATAGSVWQVVGGAALWGLHMGATQGLPRRWSSTRHRMICAAPPSAFTVWSLARRCSAPACSPAGCGANWDRLLRLLRALLSRLSRLLGSHSGAQGQVGEIGEGRALHRAGRQRSSASRPSDAFTVGSTATRRPCSTKARSLRAKRGASSPSLISRVTAKRLNTVGDR